MLKAVDLNKNQSIKEKIIKGVLGVGGVKLASIPLTMAGSILLARYLGPADYGEYVFAISLMSLLSLPFGQGVGPLVTREISKYYHGMQWGGVQGVLRRSYQWALAGGMIVSIVTIVLSIFFAEQDISGRWLLIGIAALIVPALGLNSVRSGALRGLGLVVFAQLPEMIIKPLSHLLVCIILIFTACITPENAIFSLVLATLISYFFGAYCLSRSLPYTARDFTPEYNDREWVKSIGPFTILAAVGMLNNQIGVLFLGWFADPDDVAVMQISMSGSSLIVFFMALINMVIAPYIVLAWKEKDIAKLKKMSRYSSRVAFLAALPIGLLLVFYGAPIIDLLYGDDYVDSAVLPLAILTLAQLFNVACGSVGQFLAMTGHEKETLSGQVFALIVSFLLMIYLAPIYGAVGAAISFSSGLIVWNVILIYMVKKRLGFMPTVLG